MKKKPEKIGTVWTAYAKLYDINRAFIATCIDTPNAIAKAFMELSEAKFVTWYRENNFIPRENYKNRMESWNVAKSGLQRVNE